MQIKRTNEQTMCAVFPISQDINHEVTCRTKFWSARRIFTKSVHGLRRSVLLCRLHFYFKTSPQTSVTSADLLHNNQVLSTPGSICCFSDDFTTTPSVICCPGFSSRLYSCFRFFRRQNKMMFTIRDRRRQAIKGITIVQLRSETTE